MGYHFANELRRTLKVPVGIIHTSYGGTPAESWTSREKLQADPRLKSVFDKWNLRVAAYPAAKKKFEEETFPAWQKAVERSKAENKPAPAEPKAPSVPPSVLQPSILFNAMLNPVIPYGIRGAIWYQGEANGSEAPVYKILFPMLIKDWRTRWNQGEFPFLYVQLANFRAVQTVPSEGGWGWIREAQLMSLSTPNTGMASAIDLADAENPNDIHPHNKREVGRRLSLIALAKTYGQKVASYSGPIYSGMKVEGNKVRLSFAHADGGLAARDGDLKGFAIAGKDGKFIWGTARIEGNSVVVSSEAVPEPTAVHYSWAWNPIGNLYNKAGLPASPFRTDAE